MHIRGRKPLRQIGRRWATETQAEVMPRPQVWRHALQIQFVPGPFGNRIHARLQGGEYARDAPFEQQFERCLHGWREREVAALTDIEAACSALILTPVVDKAREVLRILARDPTLLNRSPLLPARCDIQEAGTVRPEQPLVGAGRNKIWIDLSHVEGQRAKGLAAINA